MCQLKKIDQYIKSYKEDAYRITGEILDRDITDARFSGIIGAKNGTYNVEASSFSTAQEYVDAWMDNHNRIYNKEKDLLPEKSSVRIHKLIENEFLREYICKYLERTYYRKNSK